MIGQAWRTNPYRNQRQTPVENMASIPSETSPAHFVAQVFCSCGQKAQVVNVPAANPSRSIPVIVIHPFPSLTFPFEAGLPHQSCLSSRIALWYVLQFAIITRFE